MTKPPSSTSSPGSGNHAAKAGRGVIFIAFAKFYFMIAGFLIEVGLPRLLARSVFGAYKVVSSTVSPFNNVLVTGTIQAVARFTAHQDDDGSAVQRAGLRMHIFVGLPLAMLFIALAPLFAHLMHDDDKTRPLMLAGVILAGYSFYAVFVGTANGRREFHKQAGLDVTMATMRAAGILGMAALGLGVMGAIAGWVGATLVILAISILWVGWPKSSSPALPLKPVLLFFLGTSIYLVLLNFLLVIDTLLLKRLASEWFLSHSETAKQAISELSPSWLSAPIAQVSPASAADAQVGYYGAVQNLARLPYQAILAVTFVIFPLISRSTFENDRETTKVYIQTTLRYSLLFCTAIAVAFAANPIALLDVPYDRDYAETGGQALAALSIGTVGFALFAISCTILNSAGHTRQAIISAFITLILAAAANWILIPMTQPGPNMLLACAASNSGAMLIGAGVAGLMLRKQLGAFLPWLSIVRVCIAAALAIFVGRIWPVHGTLMTMFQAGCSSLIFLITLVVLREIGKADAVRLLRPFLRK